MESTDLTSLDIIGTLIPLAALAIFVWLLVMMAQHVAASFVPACAEKWSRHMDDSPLLDAPIADACPEAEPRHWKPLSKPAMRAAVPGAEAAPVVWREVWQWDAARGLSVLAGYRVEPGSADAAPETPRRRDASAALVTNATSAGTN